MSGRENLECKSWFNNFINEFRRRYNDLPESTRKFVWNVDDFSAPCQLISIVLAGRELTYLWYRIFHTYDMAYGVFDFDQRQVSYHF